MDDESGISKISDILLQEIDHSLTIILRERQDYANLSETAEYETFKKAIEQFQPSPQLLDSKLRDFLERVIRSYIKNCLYEDQDDALDTRISCVFYQFAKVRGTKTVSNCLPSDISLISIVLKRGSEQRSWESRFFLFVWLSVLILAPFPLAKIDLHLPDKIYNVAFEYLKTGSKETDAASVLMARFLSRVDSRDYRDLFISEYFNSLAWEHESNVFAKIGILSTINRMLKILTLEQLRNHLDRILTLISNEINDDSQQAPSSILRFFIKILGKLSLFFMRLEQYGNIEDIVSNLLKFLSHNDTVIRYSTAKQLSKIGLHLDSDSRQDILESLVNLLDISFMFDEGDEFQADLHLDPETIDIVSFHGVLLTLGEFCRLRLMSKKWITITGSICHRTLFVEQHRLTYSAGSNVRDASCFDCWSIFKKYRDAEIPPGVIVTLFKDLILVSCFDGDLMIRRAASATLQELIGRHGDLLFRQLSVPSQYISMFKVKLIEILDYTALGHITKSYQLPSQIYRRLNGLMHQEFVDFLLSSGIRNYNYSLRKLSSQALKEMVSISSDYDAENVIMKLRGEYKLCKEDGILNAIADLLSLLPERSVDSTQYHAMISNFTFDFHNDEFSKGEEYLHLLKELVARLGFQLNSNELDTVFNIIRTNREEITDEFKELSKYLKDIPLKYAERWIYYVKNGNLASAKALGYSPVMRERSQEVLELLSDIRLDANLRSSLIDSVSIFLQRDGYLNKTFIQGKLKLIEQLDDYTVTNKGDVGSFIRISSIDMIFENRDFFSSEDDRQAIEMRLLRLSCEVMDNVKLRSFSLLRSLEHWGSQVEDVTQSELLHNPQKYFGILLKLYDNENLCLESSKEFWKGYSFSGGSSQAVDKTINAAVYAFLRNWQVLTNEKKCAMLRIIFSLLGKGPLMKDKGSKGIRYNKMQTSCLRFVCNLIELNLEIPPEFELESLFVRTYNMTLGSSNYLRLTIAVRILTNLYLRDPKKFHGCKKRLQWLGEKHPLTKVKARAFEALQEIEFESQE
ncbi:DEKNAAC100094 [Brettanomyces naardenensis]|uniref:DEKNAAC100094 n=1 Tax=Brettanomyces naardenensis TaxID=13370 RepID=A0A448YEV2_BRENA|nr:DEKNAAC100094 [Brettanomyces naardenensis]